VVVAAAGVELASVVGERLQGKAQVLLITPGPDILEAAPAGQREAARQVRSAACRFGPGWGQLLPAGRSCPAWYGMC